MTVSAAEAQNLKFVQATLVSGGAVLALITLLFGVLGFLPERFAFLGKVGEVLAPLLCVPVFNRVRETWQDRGAAALPLLAAPKGYRFLAFALISALILTALALFFDAVSIWQKARLIGALRDQGITIDDASFDFEMTEGDDVVVVPLMLLAGIVVGWRLRNDRIERPLAAITLIFVLMAVVRTLHLALIEHFWIPSGEETDIWTWSDFWTDILTWTMATTIGCVLGYGLAFLLGALVQSLSLLFPALSYVAPELTEPAPAFLGSEPGAGAKQEAVKQDTED